MRRWLLIAIGAVLAVTAAEWARGGLGAPKAAAAHEAAAGRAPQAAPTSASLQAIADEYQALADQWPAELIDLDALAASLTTPQSAFEFVRDRIALEPYWGSKRAPPARS